MMSEQLLTAIADVSRYLGENPDFAMAGGGNTSVKTGDTLWVKASGAVLGKLGKDDFVPLDRDKLESIIQKAPEGGDTVRPREIKIELFRACRSPEKGLTPSIESLLHHSLGHVYVVHTHPTVVNGLMCSAEAEERTAEIFGDDALYIPFAVPGDALFQLFRERAAAYSRRYNREPNIILLQNHGLIVAADSVEEIRRIHAEVISSLESKCEHKPDMTSIEAPAGLEEVLPALRMMLSGTQLKVVRWRRNRLTEYFARSAAVFRNVSLPLNPDHVAWCKPAPMYIEYSSEPGEICRNIGERLTVFRKEYNEDPGIVLIQGMGAVSVATTVTEADLAMDVYENLLKTAFLAMNFGGCRQPEQRQIGLMRKWEADKQLKVDNSGGTGEPDALRHRVALVTGGAQGFGAGLARCLVERGVNVMIADLAVEAGREKCRELNELTSENMAAFVQADVANENSVAAMIRTTVRTFGGLDLFISNAGILKAGGLDEMDGDTFDLMTKVNYKGYFLGAKYASAVMKLQHHYNLEHFTDIIQINSKSGLKGSKKNFTYAGGKFGGIGLTQSFALELVEYNIKVNAVCPGNFFDGPLWGDPENGLFVQYLRAAKVPGARTVEDVKAHYEKQVPMNRGCRVVDLMRAVDYIVNQQYETGQALPVTGGQNMLK